MRLDRARVCAAAAQAGFVGAQVNGSVTTVIGKAGPGAKARTRVNGNRFQEERTQNGAQMRKADRNIPEPMLRICIGVRGRTRV